jgi:hypothetical protein
MKKAISAKQKSAGRPATGITPMMGFRADPVIRAAIVRWAENQTDMPTLSEAIRRLVELGLTLKAPARPVSKPDRRLRAAELAAIERAQIHDLPEGKNHPPRDPNERWVMLANLRQAIAQQLLTPAPDTAAIAWKKAALAGGDHEYTDVKPERIERAIADDVAFLTSHPTRIKRGAS